MNDSDYQLSANNHVIDRIRDEKVNEIEFTASNIIRLLKLVKAYCFNSYLKYIMIVNSSVAFITLSEERKAMRLFASLDSIIQQEIK
jgi:hypothetical protein